MAYDIPEGFEEVKASSDIPEGFEEVKRPEAPGFFSRAKEVLNRPINPIEAIPGTAEAIAGGVGEMANAAVSGIYGPIKSLFTDKSAADEITGTMESIRSAIPYMPETKAGQDLLEAMGLLPEAMHAAGETTYDKTGSPLLATGVETLGNAALLAPLLPRKAKPVAEIPKGFEEVKLPADPAPPKPAVDAMRQMELFDQPEMGRVANPYEAKVGDWRIDENGIPIKADLSMELQNLENPRQRNLWGDELENTRNPVGQSADLFAENGYQQGHNIDIGAPEAFRGPRSQRGAISADAVKDMVDLYKRGMASGHKVIEAFKGAFHPEEMAFMKRAIENPGNKNAVVLMSPDEFHNLAATRSPDYMAGKEPVELRNSIRRGLESAEGLRDIPQLYTITKDGVAQVRGHEGRHRMDVFKEMGIDQVPVLIKDKDLPWDKRASKIVGEAEYEIPNAAERQAQPFPHILNNELKVRGPRSQRGAVHPDLLGMGITEKIVDLFKKSREAAARPFVSDDPYLAKPSDKAAHTRANRALFQELEKNNINLGKALVEMNRIADFEGMDKLATPKGPKSQRGALSPELIKDLERGLKKIGDMMERLGGQKVSPYTDKERVVLDAVGERTFIPKGEDPKSIIQKALAEGKDGEHLFQNWQSGLANASEKVKSAVMLGTARWLNYAHKMGDRLYRLNARPVEQAFARLNTKDMIAAMDQMREDMFNRTEGDTSHLSPKAQEALAALRKAHEKALLATNESLLAMGKKPITPQEAYMASMWTGNYHVPIFDKKGKLAWYLKLETKAEAQRALDFLKNDPVGAELNLADAKIAYHPVNVGSRVPRDVMGAYQDMLQFFDGETAAQMKLAMEQYTQEKGYTFQQHQKHFENKANVRGFMGDRPWLSPKANAKAQAQAQFNYLREAFEWAPMQESLAAIKEILSDPELNKQQPNNMELVKNYVSNQMGVSKNVFRAAEQEVQRLLTDLPAPLVKVVPHSIARFVHSTKTLTYLQQLGMSAGYAIATPLQAFILGPAWHLKLTGEGFKHNVFQTSSRALYDFALGILGHETKSAFGHGFDMPMSKIGKDAFKYMEDNGIVSQNIFHENSGFGDYPPLHVAKSLVGWTISMPEKIARASTFMSFVHHLDASGKFKNQAEMFRFAEELTNNVLTDFNRTARPLIVDKLGQTGELSYTYKSAIFNQWNNLGIFARDATKGKPGALLAALFMTGLLGGTSGLPGINELDGLWNITKEAASQAFPSIYPKLSPWDVKGTMLKKMAEFSANKKVQEAIGVGPAKFIGDTVNYGLPSAVTGSQLASRFSSSIADPANLTGNIAPAFQEVAQVAKAAGDAMSNTTTGYASAAWKMLPPALQGILENNVDAFKTVKQKGRQGYANPNKLSEHQTTYARTPDEEFKRNFGLRSLDEATTKSDRFINNQETARLKQAQEASMKSMFDAIVRKDKEDVKKYAKAYFENDGAERFEADLNRKIEEYAYTPEQRAMIKAQSILALKSVRRFRQLHYGR